MGNLWRLLSLVKAVDAFLNPLVLAGNARGLAQVVEPGRMLEQFDRFSHSMTIWSPDSEHFVLAIIDVNQQPQVIESEATGSSTVGVASAQPPAGSSKTAMTPRGGKP